MNLNDDDLLIEILSRLPVKSLLQFRRVSKSWHSLIGNKLNHKKKLPPAMLGLFNKKSMEFISLKSKTYIDPSSVDTAFSFMPPSPSSLYMTDCCNGLLLFEDDSFDPSRHRLYICNPATRMWAHIPNPPPPSDPSILALAFDSSRGGSSHYNVLSLPLSSMIIIGCDDGQEKLSYVFSSKTGEWSKFETTADLDWILSWAAMGFGITFLNGVVYVVIVHMRCVLAYDLERNQCTKIKLFEVISRCPSPSCQHIGHSRGLLHIAVAEDKDLCVFVLEGDIFVLKHEISLLSILEMFTTGSGSVYLSSLEELRIIAFHPDLDILFLLVEEKLIISYHFVSRVVEEVDYVHDRYHTYCQWVAYTPCYAN